MDNMLPETRWGNGQSKESEILICATTGRCVVEGLHIILFFLLICCQVIHIFPFLVRMKQKPLAQTEKDTSRYIYIYIYIFIYLFIIDVFGVFLVCLSRWKRRVPPYDIDCDEMAGKADDIGHY